MTSPNCKSGYCESLQCYEIAVLSLLRLCRLGNHESITQCFLGAESFMSDHIFGLRSQDAGVLPRSMMPIQRASVAHRTKPTTLCVTGSAACRRVVGSSCCLRRPSMWPLGLRGDRNMMSVKPHTHSYPLLIGLLFTPFSPSFLHYVRRTTRDCARSKIIRPVMRESSSTIDEPTNLIPLSGIMRK